jgi:hypothetical protein
MPPLTALWLPVLLSAVIVFVASAIVHMVLPFHRQDWKGLPKEAEAMSALRTLGIPPGDYMMPHGEGPSSMKDPAFIEKRTQGPVVIMTVMKSGPPRMGKELVQWFFFCVLVSLFAGYVASRALPAGAHYLDVFRFVGTVAFVGYGLRGWPESIWYKRSWGTTLRDTIDGLVYGLLAAGTFGWLWPR